ncbi:MAG TPA: chemotaxis protein CheX [Polyangiaceae bacterium]|jgi:chemotaxis protein CheX|nr:chemotaxis protein CheX [Polyangiaceae bacterium]
MKVDVAPAKLNEIAEKVWSMVLGLKLSPTPCDPARAEARDFVLGQVTISGNWRGSVTLGCSPSVAREAAAAMFGKPASDAEPDEIRDALGELTNMVGGNFKTLLKGECRLSVPNVVGMVPYGEIVPPPVEHLWFECSGGLVILNVREQRE